MALDKQKARERNKRWKKKNPERLKEINKLSHQKLWLNPEYRLRKRKQAVERIKKLKQIVYENYGMVCACCGEDNILFLTIDHVENDGYLDKTKSGNRNSGTTIYRRIIKQNFPDSFQVLCMNCNFGKSRNKGICPHQQ